MVQLPPLAGGGGGGGGGSGNGRSGALSSSGSNANRRLPGGSVAPTTFESICATIPQAKADPPELVSKLLQKSRDIAMPPRTEEPVGGCVSSCCCVKIPYRNSRSCARSCLSHLFSEMCVKTDQLLLSRLRSPGRSTVRQIRLAAADPLRRGQGRPAALEAKSGG